MPQYFDRYINLVADVELSQAFDDSIWQLNNLDKDLLIKLDGKNTRPANGRSKKFFSTLLILNEFLHIELCCLPDAKARFRKAWTKNCSARI